MQTKKLGSPFWSHSVGLSLLISNDPGEKYNEKEQERAKTSSKIDCFSHDSFQKYEYRSLRKALKRVCTSSARGPEKVSIFRSLYAEYSSVGRMRSNRKPDKCITAQHKDCHCASVSPTAAAG
mmetsp:Transcript_29940/g.41701  ORF Transcript_29940/g.41701 Transcript_29940/m.41701 type:complete len:123 (-) Transcript_29940:168-536(-)